MLLKRSVRAVVLVSSILCVFITLHCVTLRKASQEKCEEATQLTKVVTVIIPLEEIQNRERQRAIEPLLDEGVAQDDPRLIQAIRHHFIDPPSEKLIKMSNPLVATPQARAVNKILNQKKEGFFIECGGLDGERSSNSIYFEKKLKWGGILIEMDPSWYQQLRGKNRKSHSINACLSPHQHSFKTNFHEFSDGRGRLKIGKEKKNIRPVYCFPLYSILLAMNQTHVDYFSLDVEGFELDILETIPFDKLDITTFSVEYIHAPKGGQEYIDFMTQNGYTLNATLHKDAKTYCDDYIFVKNTFKG